mmetsp:Transcript_29983/g.26554  ORF Transcript_29983/g.26554 Transcript_29983/m.26554 type:complete len:96 (+) Transcript_29983:1096-1383(+)
MPKIHYNGHKEEDQDTIQRQALDYCYKELMPESQEKYDWCDIGFQNETNPSSDFRGVGMLGVLQMVYFIQYFKSTVMKIFKLSQQGPVLNRYPFF